MLRASPGRCPGLELANAFGVKWPPAYFREMLVNHE